MTIDHFKLLEDVHRTLEGLPPRHDDWRRALEVNAWGRFGHSSRNYWATGAGIGSYVEPLATAEVIADHLEREQRGFEDATRVYYFDGFEGGPSVIYGGWTWLGELTALHHLVTDGSSHQTIERAKRALRKHSRARVAMWTLGSVRLVEQLRYKGPGGYPACLRGKPISRERFAEANPIGAILLDRRFDWGWNKPHPYFRENPISSVDREACNRIIDGTMREEHVRQLREMLAWVRLPAEWEARRYTDGSVTTFWPNGARGGNTAPLWYSRLGVGMVETLWPYSSDRVRQNSKADSLWQREMQWNAGRLRDGQHGSLEYVVDVYRDGQRSGELTAAVPLGSRLRVRLYPTEPPLVEFDGERITGETATTPPIVTPQPKPPKRKRSWWSWLMDLLGL